MRRLDEALSDLVARRQAEGPDHLIDTLRRRLTGEAEVITLPGRPDLDTARTRSRWRGPLIAAGALAAALLIALPILWLEGGDQTTSADGASAPTATAPPPTNVAPTTTVVPTTPVLSSHLEPALLQLGDEIGFSQSGDTLWARDGDGRVAGYRDGEWQALPSLPDRVSDVAGSIDGPVWAVTKSSLWYLDDGEWQTLPEEMALPEELEIELEKVEVDRATGVVWVLSGADLYRWDGIEMSRASKAGSSREGILDEIVVAGDGTIWGARSNFYFPWMDRLARFDKDVGAWVSVRPLGGTQDLPAAIAVTPGGNLWVELPDPEALQSDPTGFALVHLDTTTGEWTTYRLPRGGGDVVADDGVVWFHGDGFSDLIRFDGKTIAVFSPGGWVDNLGLGNDGTLWITIRYERDGVYRLVIDEEPTG
jgi:streptogramin lyase